MISDAQRIPQWLKDESFTLAYQPKEVGRQICVKIKGYFCRDESFSGYGSSICEAAKEARKAREKEAVCQ